MEISTMEIFDLITNLRNSVENKKMFAIYNHLTGRQMKPCRCASKIDTVKKYLSEYLKENNFING